MSVDNDNERDTSHIVLQVKNENENQSSKLHKQPSRILHFSDGDLIEYSDDEIDSSSKSLEKTVIDPKTLGWLPWTWYQTSVASSKLLEGCDYVGEALADFLGITSPKYQFEIDEYKRQLVEAEKKLKSDQEMRSWIPDNKDNLIIEDVRARE